MTKIAVWLAQEGWILRSGGADGADTAFETGCDIAGGNKEIFLPVKDYNNNASKFHSPPFAAYELIDILWQNLRNRSYLVRDLFARNCQQILGPELTSPSNLVICWTKNGKAVGGTGKAIQLANHFQIPVINLYHESVLEYTKDKEHFMKLIRECKILQ